MGKALYEKIQEFLSMRTTQSVWRKSVDPLNRKYFKYLRNRAIFWGILLLILWAGLLVFHFVKTLEAKELFAIAGFSILIYFIIMIVHIYVLALLYVIEDSRRRNMLPTLWFLVCLLVPYLLGFILYLLVRAPLPLNCPKYDRPVPAYSKYCPNCGYSITKTCPKCGAPVPENSNFCPQCGISLRT